MNKFLYPTLLSLIGLSLLSCNADFSSDPYVVTTKFVYTISTDNTGEGVITTYDPATKVTNPTAYYTANRKNIGTNPVSINFFNHTGYITMEGENHINVIDPASTISKGTIDSLASPSHTVFFGLDKGYVTNSSDNHITIISPRDYAVTGKIELPANTFAQQPITWNGKVYINCNTPSGGKIIEIDPSEDKLAREVSINSGSQNLNIDRYGKLWTLTLGDKLSGGSVNPSIQRVDPSSMTIQGTTELAVEVGDNAPMMTMVNGTDELYYTHAGNIHKAVIQTEVTNSSVFATLENLTPTSLSIDLVSEVLYVGYSVDPSSSKVVRYDRNGIENDTFPVATNISNIGFYTVY